MSSNNYPPRQPLPEVIPDEEELLADEIYPGELDMLEDEDTAPNAPHRLDPAFVLIVLSIVTILGFNSVAADIRYTVLWSVLTILALVSIIIDRVEVERPTLRDVALGAGYGFIIGFPILVIGGPQFHNISERVFANYTNAAAFQAIAFVMPLADTLFFRAVFQSARGGLLAGIAGGLWTILLFFPSMQVIEFPLVAIVIGLLFLSVNFAYSVIRTRLGVFAAWTCQILVNVLLLFASRFVG